MNIDLPYRETKKVVHFGATSTDLKHSNTFKNKILNCTLAKSLFEANRMDWITFLDMVNLRAVTGTDAKSAKQNYVRYSKCLLQFPAGPGEPVLHTVQRGHADPLQLLPADSGSHALPPHLSQ